MSSSMSSSIQACVRVFGCVLVICMAICTNAGAIHPDTTQVWMNAYGEAGYYFDRFSESPWGDEGGIAWMCRDLPADFQPPYQWTFSFTIPEASSTCEDGRCQLARVAFILLGGICADSLGGQSPGADYISFDYDACHRSMVLCHYQYLNIYNNIIYGETPEPVVGTHNVQINRFDTGEWLLIIDGVVIGWGHYDPLPPTLGTFDVMNVYCSKATFRPYEPFFAAPDWVRDPLAAEDGQKLAKELLTRCTNPAVGGCHLQFRASALGPVELRVVDVNGRAVRSLFDEVVQMGRNDLFWDGRDDRGKPVEAATYYYVLSHGGQWEKGSIVFVR